MTRPKAIAEFIGTFTLVFAGTGAVMTDAISSGAVTHVGVAIVWGLTVMLLIYALGEVSGAHLNPAVTIGFCISRNFKAREAAAYIGCQLAGALAASLMLRGMFGNVAWLGATLPSGSVGQSFLLEVVLTFVLMLVVLSVAKGTKEQGLMAGIAIGATVGMEAMFAGPICGASMNPARSLAPAVISGNVTALWVYLLAPVLGAIFAVPVWRGMKLPEGSPKILQESSI